MAVSGEVYEQDGGVKLHPYLVALARWCVSCLWSTATAMLYRLLANPLPQLTASRAGKPRPAGRDHLDPEPRVECVVLHQPAAPAVDVIFVHGLYGSLGNTWRQGEWRSKYNIEPKKISLRRTSSIPTCDCDKQTDNSNKNIVKNDIENNVEQDFKEADERTKDAVKISEEFAEDIKDSIKMANENEITFTNIEEYYKSKRITDDDVFITERFYEDNIDRCEIIDNYETQAKFVRDLFSSENMKCDKAEVSATCSCRMDDKQCEVGCGCICDDCYSSCWPRDWIKVDYPDARVISINYTSDPYLWRPLWIKESKRLHLHERAEQMIEQLISLGVGERPIVWVGHSKGGLFIKQIYCEAYDAYRKLNGKTDIKQNCDEYDKENQENHKADNNIENNDIIDNERNEDVINKNKMIESGDTVYQQEYKKVEFNNDNDKENIYEQECKKVDFNNDDKENINCNTFDDSLKMNENSEDEAHMRYRLMSSNKHGAELAERARLWLRSSGVLFYSVPHRGSPLADLRTPLTARSLELREMGRDCALVRALQERWLAAAGGRAPRVRSVVETARTLMAVLWLRIVSVDSADAGIGALCGVSVDHREICKPSSRRCILYTELSALIHAALECRHGCERDECFIHNVNGAGEGVTCDCK